MTDQCLLRTGQLRCYNPGGREISCHGSAQDAELLIGRPWPEPRFVVDGEVVTDCLTGLSWSGDANPAQYPVGWHEAFRAFADVRRCATEIAASAACQGVDNLVEPALGRMFQSLECRTCPEINFETKASGCSTRLQRETN